MFRGVAFVVYCDKDHKDYDRILETMVQCRQKMPLQITADAAGEVDPNQGENVIFILTQSPDLLYYKFEEPEIGPQAIVMPLGKTINTFEKFLPKLKVLDGLSLKDWLEKAQDIRKTLEAMKPSDGTDGQSDENKREVMKSWFNKDRFTLETKYYTANPKRLLNSNRMKAFIDECQAGKQPLHLRSTPITEENLNSTITGEQFEHVVLNSNSEYAKLILVTHAKAKKNGSVEQDFSQVSRKFSS